MTLSTNTLRRLGTILALTAATAGAAAPAALANHQDVGVKEALKEIRVTAAIPDAVDRYLRNHPQSATSVQCDAVCRYLHNHVQGKEALKEIRVTAAIPDAVDRYLRNHPQSATSVQCDAVCRYLHNHVQGIRLITDTLGGNGHASSTNVQGYRFITDTLAPGGGTSMQIPAPGGEDFSWADAGVGAATAVGSLLVLLGSTLVVLRKRHRLVL